MGGMLSKIERALEEAVEGTTRRVFRARLQPVMLAKAASRAMQEEQLIGPDGPEVPNAYRVLISPEDYRHFGAYRGSLEGRIASYLSRVAAERGLRPVAALRVSVEADDRVRVRSVRVEARMQDEGPSGTGAGSVGGNADGSRAAHMQVEGNLGRGAIRLVCEDGRELELDQDVIALGRALENDVVVPDTRVSRFHAEIHRSADGFRLRDLKSTNGTAVAGKRVDDQRLAGGDAISLGGYSLTFRVGRD